MSKNVKHIIFAYLMLLGLFTKISNDLILAFDEVELSEQVDADKSEEEKEESEEKITAHFDLFNVLKDINAYTADNLKCFDQYKVSKGHTLIFTPPPKLS